MKTEWTCRDQSELAGIAEELLAAAEPDKVWTFEGNLGAGKTTLIQELCKKLGVVELVSSPSFSLINEYETTAGEIIYHFDFYRIINEMEAVDIGSDEYFYSGNRCFIEWPSKIPSLVPNKHVKITINLVSGNHRKITLEKYG